MKLVKKQITIYGMATDRGSALSKLYSFSAKIEEHLIKSIVYGDSTRDYNGWISELATWIDAANGIELKSNKKKPKKADFEDNLFAKLGDSYLDAKISLLSFQVTHTGETVAKPYPDFEVTDELISTTFQAFSEIQLVISTELSKKNQMDKTDIANLLHTILDKYCI